MNKIIKKSEQGREVYKLITNSGKEQDCILWYEKKTEAWHVKLPKNNESGRTYVRKSIVDALPNGYEFETKTTHRTGLTGGGWRAKMTPEEAKRMKELEFEMAKIKSDCINRKVEKLDPNSEEGIQAQIDKLMAKMAKVKANQEVKTKVPETKTKSTKVKK